MTEKYQKLMTTGLNSWEHVCNTNSSGRAVCPLAAVRLANILYTEGESGQSILYEQDHELLRFMIAMDLNTNHIEIV